jgi:MOSC domain-containing protein YiiM
MDARVVAVSRSSTHTFTKPASPSITLLAGLGVADDAHCGETVKHRSRVRRDPTQPNLRQVHLVHDELLEGLRADGYDVTAGTIGENVTTRGVDLLGLPTGTHLHLGETAVVEITGLRNPCLQLDHYAKGLMKAVLDHDEDGNLIRKAGVMAVVRTGGVVRPDDPIRVVLPFGEHQPLLPV